MLENRSRSVLFALFAGAGLAQLACDPAQSAPADSPSPSPSPSTSTARSAAPAPAVERYRVAFAGLPARGPAEAKVTIVEFMDYQCPFCRLAEDTLAEVRK